MTELTETNASPVVETPVEASEAAPAAPSDAPKSNDAPSPVPGDELGAIGAFMTKTFGRSWRTSLSGLIAVGAGVLASFPGVSAQVAHIAQIVATIAAGGGLLAAKDSKVSGLPR